MRILHLAAIMMVSTAAALAQETPAPPAASNAPPAPPQANSGSQPPAPTQKTPAEASTDPAADASKQKPDSLPSPGDDFDPHNVHKGSEDDVSAIGTRNIGARGLGNWYSTNWEISVGKQYSMQIDKTAHLVTDPVVVEYVNRIGQNLVKNSDAKVPFTIKVLDADEVNAMALPGGFLYVNSGLILACDSEDELAGVMSHEISHVIAHHAARNMTRMNYAQIASVPLMIFTQGTWTGYGIYEATQLAVPMVFLQFSRTYEAEADYLGVQWMYKTGYDPQGLVSIFEKLDALEKHKPTAISKAFEDHPATPDRIAAIEQEISTILPARPDYLVTTSEFDEVKARLERIENKRGVNGRKDGSKPTLRRAGASNNDPSAAPAGTNPADARPTLNRP